MSHSQNRGCVSVWAAVFLASRMGSTRADIARGYEMDVIAMAVLGGFSTEGGKGNWLGAVLAVPGIRPLAGKGFVFVKKCFRRCLAGRRTAFPGRQS